MVKVLILGVAYKKDIDDMRESPALEVIELLEGPGAEFGFHGPHVPAIGPTGRHRDEKGMRPVERSAEILGQQDTVIMVTNPTAVDYGLVGRVASLVTDTRGVFRALGATTARVVKA